MKLRFAIITSLVILFAFPLPERARPAVPLKNTWRGITPLHSSAADVARALGVPADDLEGKIAGPFKVDEGEVTFSYLTPSLAKIYHAPNFLVGKVFTINVKPAGRVTRSDVNPSREFKRCVADRDRLFYYMVSDEGLAYQFNRDSDTIEMIIYQPSKADVRRLAVNCECVF
jgi:hypothetical protein